MTQRNSRQIFEKVRPDALFRGTVAVTPEADGYGFIEPDGGGGQLLVRLANIHSDLGLRVGDTVRYTLAGGSFALEAVAVSPLRADAEEAG